MPKTLPCSDTYGQDLAQLAGMAASGGPGVPRPRLLPPTGAGRLQDQLVNDLISSEGPWPWRNLVGREASVPQRAPGWGAPVPGPATSTMPGLRR